MTARGGLPPALATRLAAALLWALVGGACGLAVAAFVRLPDASALVPEPPPPSSTAAEGFAERFVAQFLAGTDSVALQALTADPPAPAPARCRDSRSVGEQESRGCPDVVIEDITTVDARVVGTGQWRVVVAAAVHDLVPAPADGPASPGTAAVATASTAPPVVAPTSEPAAAARVEHYAVQVLERERTLQALAWPALLPVPAAPAPARSALGGLQRPDREDPLAVTVAGFLAALLTGTGDLERWVAPGAELAAVSPAPFAAVELTGLAGGDGPDGTRAVLAEVLATRPDGDPAHLQYPLRLVVRDRRWEVAGWLDALPIQP